MTKVHPWCEQQQCRQATEWSGSQKEKRGRVQPAVITKHTVFLELNVHHLTSPTLTFSRVLCDETLRWLYRRSVKFNIHSKHFSFSHLYPLTAPLNLCHDTKIKRASSHQVFTPVLLYPHPSSSTVCFLLLLILKADWFMSPLNSFWTFVIYNKLICNAWGYIKQEMSKRY